MVKNVALANKAPSELQRRVTTCKPFLQATTYRSIINFVAGSLYVLQATYACRDEEAVFNSRWECKESGSRFVRPGTFDSSAAISKVSDYGNTQLGSIGARLTGASHAFSHAAIMRSVRAANAYCRRTLRRVPWTLHVRPMSVQGLGPTKPEHSLSLRPKLSATVRLKEAG